MQHFKKNAPIEKKRQRVAHVTYSLNTGGMEKLLVEFARHHSTEKYSLTVFSLTNRGPIAAELEQNGCEVISLHKAEGFRFSTARSLAKKLRKRKISIVHTHNSGAMIYGSIASRLNRIPCVVHTRHGQRAGASFKQNFSFAMTAKLIDQLVCVSQDSARLSKLEGVSATRIRTIWNGIDINRFQYRPSNRNIPGITVGRLVPEKDHLTLLKAIKVVCEKVPNYKHLIVGDGPLKEKLVSQINSLDLQHNVFMLGNCSNVAQLLKDSSFFVLPSISEGVSLTLLEAMATGVPTIATRVGGNSEVIKETNTGILVPPKDPHALSKAMLQLINDPQQRLFFGLQARKRVERSFDVREMVNRYESLYERILLRKGVRLTSKDNNFAPRQRNYHLQNV